MSDKQCADSAQSAAGGTRLKSEGTINVSRQSAPSLAPSANSATGQSQSHKRGAQGVKARQD